MDKGEQKGGEKKNFAHNVGKKYWTKGGERRPAEISGKWGGRLCIKGGATSRPMNAPKELGYDRRVLHARKKGSGNVRWATDKNRGGKPGGKTSRGASSVKKKKKNVETYGWGTCTKDGAFGTKSREKGGDCGVKALRENTAGRFTSIIGSRLSKKKC